MYFPDGVAAVVFGQGSARAAHVRVHFIVFRTFQDHVAQHRHPIGIAHLPSGVKDRHVRYIADRRD